MFEQYDDLKIISQDLTHKRGLTLCALLNDEIYFLETFLEYYRNLGVERFIFVDDRSTDGSREILLEQPDVMVLESSLRFGRTVLGNGRTPLPDMRGDIIWRNVLMARFCYDAWALMVDLDEFIVLPDGRGFHDVAALASQRRARSVFGVMLDVYPEDTCGLKRAGPFKEDDTWFFDGLRHISVEPGGWAKVQYAGARVRLFARHRARRLSRKEQVLRLLGPTWLPHKNWNQKQVLHRWGENQLFLNSHLTTEAANEEMLLPMKHYKFNADLFRRTQTALRERQYDGHSREYEAFAQLLDQMERAQQPFTFRHSRPATSFDEFANTGNAILDL